MRTGSSATMRRVAYRRAAGTSKANDAVSHTPNVEVTKVMRDNHLPGNPIYHRDPRNLEPEHEWPNAWRSSTRQDPEFDPFVQIARRKARELIEQGSELPKGMVLHGGMLIPQGAHRYLLMLPPEAHNGFFLGTYPGFFLLVGSVLGGFWYMLYNAGQEPVPPPEGPPRFEPNTLASEVEALVNAVAPEATADLVACGFELVTSGPTEALVHGPVFGVLREFKGQHPLLSWSDLSGFVAFVALREMGLAVRKEDFRFGRLDEELDARREAFRPPPPPSCSATELRSFFEQFGVPPAQAVALLGGVPEGSLLLGARTNTAWASNAYFPSVLASGGEKLDWGPAILSDPELRAAAAVFAEDTLEWNRQFVEGWTRVMHAGWEGLRPLPTRLVPLKPGSEQIPHLQEVYGSGPRGW
eukprot:Hpha_TRINITY_DN30760_c0_g1::TRINITY_DN30760_c0_g1_i1::g.28403::m.28403